MNIIYSTLQPEGPAKVKRSDAEKLLVEIFENDELFEILALMTAPQETEDLVNELGYPEKNT